MKPKQSIGEPRERRRRVGRHSNERGEEEGGVIISPSTKCRLVRELGAAGVRW